MTWVDCRDDIGLGSCKGIAYFGIFLIGPHRSATNTFRFIVPSCSGCICCCVWVVFQSKRVAVCLFNAAWCLVDWEVGQDWSCLSTIDGYTNFLCLYRLALNQATVTNGRTFAVSHPTSVDFDFNLETRDTLTFGNIFLEFNDVKASLLPQIDCKATGCGIIWERPAGVIFTVCEVAFLVEVVLTSRTCCYSRTFGKVSRIHLV